MSTKLTVVQIGFSRAPFEGQGWGAVEILMRNYDSIIAKYAESKTLVFDGSLVRNLNNINPDIIIVHNEKALKSVLKIDNKKTKIFFVSHYAYLKEIFGIKRYFFPTTFVEFHHLCREVVGGFLIKRRILKGLTNKRIVPLLLDKRLLEVDIFKDGCYIENYLYSHPVDSKFHSNINRYVCVGKIEIRKQQYKLQKILSNIDFYGPIVCNKFVVDASYKGELSNVELVKVLQEYSALILLSTADLKPLVIIEALMQGIPVITYESLLEAFDNNYGLVGIERIEDLPTIDVTELDRKKIKTEARLKYDLNLIDNQNKLLSIFSIGATE